MKTENNKKKSVKPKDHFLKKKINEIDNLLVKLVRIKREMT